ncbi:hypothetical protein D9M72_374640 [compost metagenome]
MVQQLSAVPVGVHAADVADVVAVFLQETNQRVLVAEVEVPARGFAPGGKRPVVADLVGPAVDSPLVEIGPAIGVVGLPRCVGGLEDYVGMAAVGADNKGDVALAAGVRPGQQGDVDAGDGRGRDLPRGGNSPRSAIVKFRCHVGPALGL